MSVPNIPFRISLYTKKRIQRVHLNVVWTKEKPVRAESGHRPTLLFIKPQNPESSELFVSSSAEMGRAEKEQLNRTLSQHLNTIHEILEVLDQNPPSTVEKVSWEDVVQMGNQVSKQATIVGMIWSGERVEARVIEENMTAYFNMLQSFLLLSHGSMVGAGPTLSSCVHASVKQVVDSSFKLMKESVSLYGAVNKDWKSSIPQLAGAVWEACSALKKTPAANVTAIGRAVTQVAVTMKDVLREMKELKPATDPTDDEAEAEIEPHDDETSSDSDLGNDLSPEEMKVAELAIDAVSETLVVMKELIRTITGLLKRENPNDSSLVDSLEKLLKMCQGIGEQIDELGACLYPPQEVSTIKTIVEKMSSLADDMKAELQSLGGNLEAFIQACDCLKSSLRRLDSAVDCPTTVDLENRVQKIDLNN
ncbi:hypothetical protein ACLB2K_034418 [Fragaria x ananassa]